MTRNQTRRTKAPRMAAVARGLAACASLILMAAAAGACTDDDSKDRAKAKDTPSVDGSYAKQIKRIDDDLDVAMQALFSDPQMTTAEITGARTALARADTDLAELEAPGSVRQYHDQYRDGVQGFAPIVEKLAAAKGDSDRIQAHLTDPEYSKVIQNLEGAKKGLEASGYNL